jgi:hypothetical protein
MKYKLATTLLVVAALCVATLSAATTSARPALAASGTFPINGCPEDPNKPPPCANDDAVVRWNEQLLASIRANPAGTGPTITARALGVVHTATYDAWAAYDPIAKETRPDGPVQQPVSSNPAVVLANKSKAVSFAAYKTLVDLFPARESIFAAQMNALGYTNFATDTSAPAMVGNQAADAVIRFRHADGSNQTLNTNGTPNDRSDDTVTYPNPCTSNCYSPKNTWNNVAFPWRWQPLCVLTATGVSNGMPPTPPAGNNCDSPDYVIQKPLTPQWGNITSFASSPAQYKVTGPPKNPDGTYSNADVVTALNDTSNLDDVKKAKAEYWADGPKSEFPPGHMGVFAQFLCRKKGNDLDTDVKMFFALGNALMDASIGSWSAKYKYDFWRPVTAIRYLYKGQQVNSWRGPGVTPSFGMVDGKDWMPYQALTVVTPGFPEYVSGHSTFSAAGSVILANFTTSDNFGGSVTIPAGSSKIEPGTPATDVTLSWPTFTAAADEAGMSRRYGGIHFYSGDLHGRMLGNLLGRGAYSKAQAYIQGQIGT